MSNAVDLAFIEDTIYSWISSRNIVDNQKIFAEKPNIDRPIPPSITYDMLTLPAMIGSRDNISYSGTGDEMTVSGDRELTVSIKSYGEPAAQNISNLRESIELFSVQQIFQASNMAVRIVNPPSDISELLETGIEQRFNMDVIFGVTSIQTEDQGAVETVEIVDAEVKDATGATVQTINDTIEKP